MSHWPKAIVGAGHVEPCPRRIRARLDGRIVIDTTAAQYVWDHPKYPRYAFPVAAVAPEVPDIERDDADRVSVPWDSVDAWFEEDEQVYVHPRNPYARVDALRSSRTVRVERDGVLLAESDHPVVLFETGLPPRTYFDRASVEWSVLKPSDTRTQCPYKGVTSDYWSFLDLEDERVIPDLAWSYAFPTVACAAIAGLVAFYDERVDVSVDGVARERPKTGF
jgi:uncharacterized protein (DUF427 family)